MSVPTIIDTDPGVDDAVALMLAAASSELQLLAVTTVFGNAGVEVSTANSLRLRALAGLGDLPVAVGAARPLVYPRVQRTDSWHGSDGLGGCADLLPEPVGPVQQCGAVALMANLLHAAAAPVTLVAIGPLTNIALLLAAHPRVKPRIDHIVIMGGRLSGLPAEFNMHSDPEAARRLPVGRVGSRRGGHVANDVDGAGGDLWPRTHPRCRGGRRRPWHRAALRAGRVGCESAINQRDDPGPAPGLGVMPQALGRLIRLN